MSLGDPDEDAFPCGMETSDKMPKDRQRLMKTHLSFDMMPSQIMEKKNKV
jgi:hypothetical protein